MLLIKLFRTIYLLMEVLQYVTLYNVIGVNVKLLGKWICTAKQQQDN